VTAVDEALRAAVAELEAYLDGVEPARRDELVLPFATRWVLPELGLDLARLRAEARTLVEATPLSDRIVSGHADHVAYWVSQRMLVDGGQAARLARARELLGVRADELAHDGFPRVADGLRGAAALDDEPLELALAARIAETVLP
jgi:hypothetical protein